MQKKKVLQLVLEFQQIALLNDWIRSKLQANWNLLLFKPFFLGTEFFVTDMTRGRLSFQQRNFAGNRYSDHVAQLNAFQCWEEARQGGENAEINYCDHKGKFTVWKNEKFTLLKKIRQINAQITKANK